MKRTIVRYKFWQDGRIQFGQGAAIHCSIGPRGGKYVHIIRLFDRKEIKRSANDVQYLDPVIQKEVNMAKKVQKPQEFHLLIEAAYGAKVKVVGKVPERANRLKIEFLEDGGSIFFKGDTLTTDASNIATPDQFKKMQEGEPLQHDMIDLHNPAHVEVIGSIPKGELWVNVNGQCQLRIKGIPEERFLFDITGLKLGGDTSMEVKPKKSNKKGKK